MDNWSFKNCHSFVNTGVAIIDSCTHVGISPAFPRRCLSERQRWRRRRRGACEMLQAPQRGQESARGGPADKQQHLVTFWSSYGGFRPPLGAAPRWQELGVRWNSGGNSPDGGATARALRRNQPTSANDITRRGPPGSEDRSPPPQPPYPSPLLPESHSVFQLITRTHRQCVGVCVWDTEMEGRGGGGLLCTLCRTLSKMLSTADKLLVHLLWEEALSV